MRASKARMLRLDWMKVGEILSLDVRITANLGANIGPSTIHPVVSNIGGIVGVYDIPASHVRVDGVFTNTQNMSPYRGAGRPEATYIIERVIDIAAQQLGFDKVELRRRNMIQPSQMPFETGLVFTYDSGNFPKVLETALDAADWIRFDARRVLSKSRGKIRGLGIVNPIEIAGGPERKPHSEFARITVTPDGKVEVVSGSSDSGQGHAYRICSNPVLTAWRRSGICFADRQVTHVQPHTEQAHSAPEPVAAAGTSIVKCSESPDRENACSGCRCT
jgi:CO/xanthine dehydrogenase Mo-binding subunit